MNLLFLFISFCIALVSFDVFSLLMGFTIIIFIFIYHYVSLLT